MTTLVVSDLDGTLLTPEKQITPRSKAAVADVLAAGIRFTVISSRPLRGMRWIVEEMNLHEPFPRSTERLSFLRIGNCCSPITSSQRSRAT
jgi:hydroxymethylpyrimidine pyrophosphatase-like HAD family hydrolase